ncbi:MAG: TetR/AcrR family transcriptional regulator [Pseudomonadota bacterium]
MAQKSKKDHIVATALPLFLENGFKGTSIDLVVKASEVSKPTVYNLALQPLASGQTKLWIGTPCGLSIYEY